MRLKKSLAVVLVSISLLTVCAPAAHAATALATMLVSATVLSVCTIAALPLTFGNYSATALNASTTVSVVCTVTSPYNVSLDAGTGTGGTVATRHLTNGAAILNYKLFSDAARTINIGQTVGTDTIAGVGNGLTQTITIYGQILPNQFVTPGTYTDTVTATITY